MDDTQMMISSLFDFGHTITEAVMVCGKQVKQSVMYPCQLAIKDN